MEFGDRSMQDLRVMYLASNRLKTKDYNCVAM